METILIFRQLSAAERAETVQRLADGGVRAVAAPRHFPEIAGPVVALPSEIARNGSRRLLEMILGLGDRRLAEKTLSETVRIENLPIWHYQRFRIFFRLQPSFILREAAEYYLKSSARLTVYCEAGQARILKELGEDLRILEARPAQTSALNPVALLNYGIYFKIRVLQSLLFPTHLKKRKHLLIDRAVKQQCRHAETLELKYDNYTLSGLLDQAGDDFLIVSETEQPKLRGDDSFRLSARRFSSAGRRKNTINGEFILLKGMLSPSLYRERRKMIGELGHGLELLKAAGLNVQESMILDAFIGLAPTNNFYITRFLAYRKFFRKHSFLTVSSIDENSPAARCILDAARSTGALSIGIQHGNIGDLQPAYLYTKTDSRNRIMADYTLVWGEYWREFLIEKGNFPVDSVQVTGQIRTDIIPKMLENQNRFRHEFSAAKPVAVFASQPIPDPAARRQAAYDVFNAFSRLPDYELVVKLHPGEKDATAYYRQIADEAGCRDFRLLYDVDLYSLLTVAALVITCYSTVGTEAVYFGKPLIILDPHREDLLGYHKAGVAFQATNAQDLELTAREILSGAVCPDSVAYRSFIDRFSFAVDGKAVQRTLSFIRGVKSRIAR